MIDKALSSLIAAGTANPPSDDLELRSTEELEVLWRAEMQRLGLIKSSATIAGAGATIAAARFLLR